MSPLFIAKKILLSVVLLLLAGNCVFAQTKDTYNFRSNGNPVITHKFTADPAALVVGDTLWLFTGHDEGRRNKGLTMKDWCVFSTTDLVNWTEYPTPLKVSDFTWDKTGRAYAAQAIARNGKYYWYISTDGSGIGVAVADRPEGPYKDAIGKPLLTNADCFASTHKWTCIDPSVLIDNDGQAWLFWGNGVCYYAKLKGNMIEIDGAVNKIDFEGLNFTEAPWIHTYNGKYYLSYADGFPERIAYAMADHIEGPYTYKGILNEVAGNSDSNHQSIVEFKGNWYFIYHNGIHQTGGSGSSRSVCIDRLDYNADGTMKRVIMTTEGIPALSASANTGKEIRNTFAKGEFKKWAQTPPMGWNSWDCYGPTVKEDEVKANADYMAQKLKKYGWEYVVVDIRWFVENDKAGGYNQTDPRYVLDQYGRYQPAVNRFPSAAGGKGFKELADYVHRKGLKFGIHIMRGIPKEAVEKNLPIKDAGGVTASQIYTTELQCRWLRDNYTILADKPGAQEYYNSIFDLYAEWGVDFVKIDDVSRPYHKAEIELIRKAIDQCGRPIVLSLSPGETPIEEVSHVKEHANMWRMVDDVWDKWRDITHLLKVAQKWYPYIAPGTWPDCDMIPLGRISVRGERGKDRMTNLTKDEQYTLMTLFTIFRSPLMFGGDLPSNDDFTLSLLTNKEVLRMHRESTDVSLLFQDETKVAITSRHPQTNEVYLALFNISDHDAIPVSVNLKDLGLNGDVDIVNMWTGERLGEISNDFSYTLKPHASGLYKLTNK